MKLASQMPPPHSSSTRSLTTSAATEQLLEKYGEMEKRFFKKIVKIRYQRNKIRMICVLSVYKT